MYFFFRTRPQKCERAKCRLPRPVHADDAFVLVAPRKKCTRKRARGCRSGKERFVVHKYYLYILHFVGEIYIYHIFFCTIYNTLYDLSARGIVSRKEFVATNGAVFLQLVCVCRVKRALLPVCSNIVRDLKKKEQRVSEASRFAARMALECLRSIERTVVQRRTWNDGIF